MRRAQHINKEGLALIERFEGFSPNFYKDPVGIKTIGYGHACHVNDCSKIRPPISRAEGEALLKKDLARFEKCVESLTRIKLNSNQFSALCSFTFNLGCGAYQKSTLRRKLNAGDTKGASLEFRKWVYGGGKKLPGLVRQRKAERALFCKSGGC
ncbi:putative phage-related lysozyme [Rhizophagus irregularis]|uniref:Putative phage-related lysozyme n=1 Tax=Rhizophagus irregularis TaxID=588596 RepID=A0A2I1GAE4_9GLOM|nr:putative phage-related lysozyme [Rhizophagus irregularis]